MKRRPPLALFCAAVLLGTLGSAQALELDLAAPAPTLHGDRTVFSATATDAAGKTDIRWDFGDGTVTEFAPATRAEHSYAAPGHYSVTAVGQDEAGFASASLVHTVHTAPSPSTPQSSSPLLLDARRGLVITANTDNGTVTLVNSGTLEKTAEIEVFADPVALALAPDGMLWVLHRDVHAIVIVDLDEARAVDSVRLPYASLPAGLVFSSRGDAYVTLMATGEVVRLDAQTFEIIGRRRVAPFLRGVTVSGDGSSLWVTRFISGGDRGEVYRLDAETLETVARYDLAEDTTTEDSDAQGRGLPNYLFSVAVTPDGRRAWVPSKKDNMSRGLKRDGQALTQDSTVRPLVSILDLVKDEEIVGERIDLDDRNLPQHVAFTSLGDWAFISVFGSNLVELRDAFDGSFVTALRGDDLRGPVASLAAPGNRLLVLSDLSRKLIVYDVANLLAGVELSARVVAEVPLVAREKLSSVVLRGKQIFANAEDKRMASEGYVSCSSCHFDGFEDGRVWDFFDRGEGFRNTTSLLGRRGTGHGRVHWSGNFDEIQDFENPIRAHQGGLGFLDADVFEKGTVSEPLGDPKSGLDPDLDALAAYVSTLDRVPRSPFRNPDGSLTHAAVAGRAVFHDLECDTCHAGEDFTDSIRGQLHDVGTLDALSGRRLGGDLTGIDTPTLLGIWQTAPYLHDGSAATLRDVLTTRNPSDRHGKTSFLSQEQLGQLVAYLEQLDQGLPPETPRVPARPGMSDAGAVDGGGMVPADGGSGAGGVSADGGAGGAAGAATGRGGGGSPGSPSERPSGCECNVTNKLNGVAISLPGWVAFMGVIISRRRQSRARRAGVNTLRGKSSSIGVS